MSRTRRSARQAGTKFERHIADYLADVLDDRIDRRVKTGAKDRGDIGGVRRAGQRIVIECKDTSVVALAGWAAEAAIERGNDDALAGVVVHKRRGVGDPARQWVSMELAEFVAILAGQRPPDWPLSEQDGPSVQNGSQALTEPSGRSERDDRVLRLLDTERPA